jgi:hypothetical protein
VLFDAKLDNYEINPNGSFISPNSEAIFEFSDNSFTVNDLTINSPTINDRVPADNNKEGYVYLTASAKRTISENELKNINKRFALCLEFNENV